MRPAARKSPAQDPACRFPTDYTGAAATTHADSLLELLEDNAAVEILLAGTRDIITRLDTVMHNKFRRDPDKLHAWKSASRTERASKTKETPENFNPFTPN